MRIYAPMHVPSCTSMHIYARAPCVPYAPYAPHVHAPYAPAVLAWSEKVHTDSDGVLRQDPVCTYLGMLTYACMAADACPPMHVHRCMCTDACAPMHVHVPVHT